MNEFSKYKFVVLSDLHLPVNENANTFNNFLTFLEKISQKTENIIFLGDIFEIWSSVSPFNHKNGTELLKTVEKLSKNCNFFLVEGNYDFFICDKYKQYFNKCSKNYLSLTFNNKNFIFTHGHLYTSFKDKIFISLLKSKFMLFAIEKKLIKPMAIKKEFEKTKYGKKFENNELNSFTKKLGNKFKNKQIICGHFHTNYENNNVTIVPDYLSTKSYLTFDGEYLQISNSCS